MAQFVRQLRTTLRIRSLTLVQELLFSSLLVIHVDLE
jgi:hypothetical protein